MFALAAASGTSLAATGDSAACQQVLSTLRHILRCYSPSCLLYASEGRWAHMAPRLLVSLPQGTCAAEVRVGRTVGAAEEATNDGDCTTMARLSVGCPGQFLPEAWRPARGTQCGLGTHKWHSTHSSKCHYDAHRQQQNQWCAVDALSAQGKCRGRPGGWQVAAAQGT